MAVNLSPIGGVAGQFFDNNGNPLSGGKIFTYAAGTTTNQATYTSATGVTAHTNPIILDAAGRVPGGEIWLTDGLSYKFVIKTNLDVLIGTFDNIAGINSNFVNYTIQEEIQTATAGQTVFTLTTMSYAAGTNSLTVFVDGVNQYDGVTYAYVETSSTVVTFTAGLHVGALVKFTTAIFTPGSVGNAADVVYDPAGTGAVPTSVQAKLRETVSVKDFGAVGDGVADDTVAIQAAIDAVGTNGGCVNFPSGSYYLTNTLEIINDKVYLKGVGTGASILTRDTDYGDTIYIHGNDSTGTLLNNIGVSELSFYSSNLITSGAHINANGVNKMTIDNLYMNNGFRGIELKGVVASTVNNLYILFTNLYGGTATDRKYLYFGNATGSYAHPSCGDVFVSNFNLRGNTANQITEYGLQIVSADGLWFENGHIGNCSQANIHIAGVTAELLNLVFFSNVMIDEGINYGLLIAGNTPTTFKKLQFSNCMFKSGGAPALVDYGIYIAIGCTVQAVQFTNCAVTEYAKDGITIGSSVCQQIDFNNCQIYFNGRDDSTLYSGYKLLTGASKIRITGGLSGAFSNQAYGIQLSTSHTDLIFTGIDLTGNNLASVNGYSIEAYWSNCNVDTSATVASASSITPISGRNFISVTGTTNIEIIADAPDGTVLTLQFANILTVKDATGNLSLAGDFITNANDTLTLMHIGASWVELSRSVN